MTFDRLHRLTTASVHDRLNFFCATPQNLCIPMEFLFFLFVQQETYIVHKFDNDFYGKQLKLCICGYLRPEKNFESLDSLIEAIDADIRNAKDQLDIEPFAGYQLNDFFKK